jgi:ATP-dependent RNA helicase SUPV3L1/SUV3
VQAFVDDEAGTDVAEKVTRRLQHFIDRKVQALFEPLATIEKDETLTGLARGFGFRMIESLGIIPRDQVAGEVKELDQDARGALRKHGVRFGQFTIFMPLLLKPAPTRLRLVLWALAEGLDEFPESPPPGLVTIPSVADAPGGYYAKCGYHKAGERAIRIDMLERLADLLRVENSRAGFEANPDMLSITGMTLEQFANLMEGLGYAAAKGEREKVKPVAEAAAEGEAPAEAEKPADAEAPADSGEAEGEAEKEVFYTFTWAGNRKHNANRRAQKPGGAPKGKGKPKGKRPPRKDDKPRNFAARPPKKDKIDPDNPFAAALMGLKGDS